MAEFVSANGDGAAAANAAAGGVPSVVAEAVLADAEEMPEGSEKVRGWDFNNGVDFDGIMRAMKYTGFQTMNLGLAVEEINRMRAWRLSDDAVLPQDVDDPEWSDPAVRAKTKCKIFLSFTSNLISSGLRETIRFLVQHKMVDVVCTTAGGIEEDFIKCLADTYLGSKKTAEKLGLKGSGFHLKGSALRKKGINRIGNMLVPNSNYCAFEEWMDPILDAMLEEQKAGKETWTPSKMIHRFGKEIDDPDSVWYWAAKNDIPVFCPAITDGSIGDMIYFHSYRNPGLVVDIAGDIRRINDEAINAKKTGMVILGGGLVKHHTCNANLMRNGAAFSVYVNTGQEFDGSDSGARPDEAVSWGKIRLDAKPVKVYADATLVFPLIVAQTFAKGFAAPALDAEAAASAARSAERRKAIAAKKAAAAKAKADNPEEAGDGTAQLETGETVPSVLLK